MTETDYEVLRGSIASLLGEYDDYLEVFLDDMAYSDTPIHQNISESLADIYQPIKDFICVFQLGLEHTMNDSLAICRELFAEFWGQRLVNVMRALHDVKYRQLRTAVRKRKIPHSTKTTAPKKNSTKALTWATTNNPKPVN